MQAIAEKVFVEVVFALLFFITFAYAVALLSGWRLLARRFRTQRHRFPRQKWYMQSAGMRALSHYGNCLTIGAGADVRGLYMSAINDFIVWHPPLFIPWSEISVEQKNPLSSRSVEFRLGSTEKICFKVSNIIGAKIKAAAGPNWPTPYCQAPATIPPPIG